MDPCSVGDTRRLLQIVKEVAAYYEISSNDVLTAKRGRAEKNVPRWIAIKLCQDVGGAKLTEIADLFNVSHYSTVSQTIGRLNRLMQVERDVAKVVYMLSQDLTP